MMTRAQWVRAGYSAANAYIVLTFLFLLLEATRFRSRISDYGAPILLLSLFIFIPLSAIVLWRLNRPCRTEHSRPQRVYLMASRALFSFTWIASCLPVAFWIALVQPWPLTLRNGPDTNYAQQGFAKRIGFAPPDSVSNIYYRADEGWMDSGYRLRFNCNDESLVKQIVARLQLKETRNPVMGALSKSPKWWAEIEQRQNLRHYTRKRPGAYYWYLWYDPVTGTVWYEEFSV